MRSIIVAYDQERAIGAHNDLLWTKSEMAADMEFFRRKTMGAALIMGRKTLESIGIALPGRETIVITRADSVEIPNIQIAHSLDEAFQKADETGRENVYVCGGGEIYRQAIDDVERIYATEVGTKIEGADTFFPDIDECSWRIISKLNFQSGEKNIYPYSLVTYERADNE